MIEQINSDFLNDDYGIFSKKYVHDLILNSFPSIRSLPVASITPYQKADRPAGNTLVGGFNYIIGDVANFPNDLYYGLLSFQTTDDLNGDFYGSLATQEPLDTTVNQSQFWDSGLTDGAFPYNMYTGLFYYASLIVNGTGGIPTTGRYSYNFVGYKINLL